MLRHDAQNGGKRMPTRRPKTRTDQHRHQENHPQAARSDPAAHCIDDPGNADGADDPHNALMQ